MVTFDEYRAIPAANFSTLKYFERSPLHYRHALAAPHSETPSTRIGSAFHCLALEPGLYDSRYAVYEGRRDARTAAYKGFLAANEGKTILSSQEQERAMGLAGAVVADPMAARHIDGEHEVSLAWTDGATGIECKARLDCIGAGVTDLKSARTVDLRRFMSAATDMQYYVQLAWYHDAAIACGYELTEPPRIVAVESAQPHVCAVFTLGEAVLDVGRVTYRRWLEQLAECRERDEWPGPYEHEVEFAFPPWFGRSDDEFFADMEIG